MTNVFDFTEYASRKKRQPYDVDEHGELRRRNSAPLVKPSAKATAKPRAKAFRRHPSYRREPPTADVVSLVARRHDMGWARHIPVSDLLDWLAGAERYAKLTYADTRKLDILRARMAARLGLFPQQQKTLAAITRRVLAKYAETPQPPQRCVEPPSP